MVPELDFKHILTEIAKKQNLDYPTSYWKTSGALTCQELMSWFSDYYDSKSCRTYTMGKKSRSSLKSELNKVMSQFVKLAEVMGSTHYDFEELWRAASDLRIGLRAFQRLSVFEFKPAKSMLIAIGGAASVLPYGEQLLKLIPGGLHGGWEMEYAIYSLALASMYFVVINDSIVHLDCEFLEWDRTGLFMSRDDAVKAIDTLLEGIYSGFDFSDIV